MASSPLHPLLEEAARITADSLVPCQQDTPHGLRDQCDYHEKVLIKHPHRSQFHSREEYLLAGLKEGDSTIDSFVPQPYKLRTWRGDYIPDDHSVGSEGKICEELKPGGEMDEALRRAVSAFLSLRNIDFRVISNESVRARETEACNWLQIVQILHLGRDWDTASEEASILNDLWHIADHTMPFGTWVDPGDREGSFPYELAVLRLLHRHKLRAPLNEVPLDFDTAIELCV